MASTVITPRNPGEVLKPFSWEELVSAVSSNRLELLGRVPEKLQYYREQMAIIRLEFESIEDYLHHNVFGYSTTTSTNGKLMVVHPIKHKKIIVFRKNDFPYSLEEGIEHYLLWSTEELTIEEIEENIKNNIPKESKFCYFVNPPILRSVKTIHHAHVLFKI